jgi:replicative DNA helicase
MTFTIAQTKTTPFAEFRDGYLVIRGKSVPFDKPEIYDIINDRLVIYSKNPEKHTYIDFIFSAVNAVSKRHIINTFRLLEQLNKKGTDIKVNWFYQDDNEDIRELGEICKSYFKMNIQLKIIS